MHPSDILGVGPNAGEEEIRAAYVRKVKEHPSDRSPEEFEKIRDAYDTLRDPRRRMREIVLAADPEAPLTALLESQPKKRRMVGPQAWLEVLTLEVLKPEARKSS